MEFVAVLGFLIVVGALIYLAAHGIMKLNNPSKVLPKKRFYPILGGGILVFVFGIAMVSGTKAELDEAIKSNEVITAENGELSNQVVGLEKEKEENVEQINNLTTRIEELETESSAVEKKAEELAKAEEALKEKEASYKSENEELQDTLSQLQSENTALERKVNKLEGQLTTASIKQSNASSNQTSTTTSSRKFANCTDLRTVHPSGVSSDHPDYQPAMDRDKDGWACER